ncbi:unnamed protein product [Anisakis simplex]|uniref:Cytochrome P450 4V2 (inferred by orthology to a human protein) n=1 Tax=Anisakis simplex TaxID=6269 RepID=A0A0M3J4M0_ANISI|nr:unnamed protein product [Anisakis simplex]
MNGFLSSSLLTLAVLQARCQRIKKMMHVYHQKCIYNKHAQTLLHKFERMTDGEYHNIFQTISLCTIDVICEAALGTHVDAQNKQSPYLEAVKKMKYIVHQRTIKPQFYPRFLFDLFGEGQNEKKCVKELHEFTRKAIMDRKKLADEAGGVEKLLAKEEESGKRRMALLDLMLDMHAKGDIPLEGVQEEVDTFTFEVISCYKTSFHRNSYICAPLSTVFMRIRFNSGSVWRMENLIAGS